MYIHHHEVYFIKTNLSVDMSHNILVGHLDCSGFMTSVSHCQTKKVVHVPPWSDIFFYTVSGGLPRA